MAVLPAHAGMSPEQPEPGGSVVGAARACGDEPLSREDLETRLLCCPRMRG